MARYTKGHKEESRTRIVEAAGRGFRRQGFSGIGVDGLASEAGVTHGAFYGHSHSKTEAFRAAVAAGLQELRTGLETLQEARGAKWLAAFVTFYMAHKRTCEPGQACTLPSLSPDVERADMATRQAYQDELQRIVATIATGLPGNAKGDRAARAWALLSLVAGGVSLARAVPDPVVSGQIARAVSQAAVALSRRRS
jgi:AcrR family transcriptional regulator